MSEVLGREEIAARVEADDEVSISEYMVTMADLGSDPEAYMFAVGYAASFLSGNERLEVLAAVRDQIDQAQATK